MELDEMKSAWQQVSDRLDRLADRYAGLRLEMQKNEVARSLRSTIGWIGADIVGSAVTLGLLGAFVASEHAWRFIVPALVLYPVSIAILASGVAQCLLLVRLDYGEPVVAIQARLGRLYTLRLRTLQLELLFACLLWVPIVIVFMRGVARVDLYALGPMWLAANAAFGVLVVPVLWLIARSAGPRFRRTAFGRFLLEEVTGRGLAKARRRMAEIARFERD